MDLEGGHRKATRSIDVLVIGAGQAGLSSAHFLKAAGIDHVVVEAGVSVGDNWRYRYESLSLFTPRNMSGLPGLPLAGNPDGYATGSEFADYLTRYALTGSHRVDMQTRVRCLNRTDRGFEAEATDGRRYVARVVIVATGGFQIPNLPILAADFGPDIRQMHVAEFRVASDVEHGPVLVVGDGASGRDVALAFAGQQSVTLARGRPRKLFPEKLFGRSAWWWLNKTGLLAANRDSIVGRRMRRMDPFPARGNDDRTLQRGGVYLVPRLVKVLGDEAVFADGGRMRPKTVIWATGYRDDFGWIAIDAAKGPNGGVLHEEGMSPVEGLHFVGRPWQRNRASGLIIGAADDAGIIVAKIDKFLGRQSRLPLEQASV